MPISSKVDVFHCHGLWGDFEPLLGLFLSKRFCKPIIFELHGIFGANPESMSLDQRKLYVLKHSNIVICRNKSIIQKLKEMSGEKLVFIPTCVDTSIYHPNNTYLEENKSILFLGRLTELKDPITPILAMKFVVKTRPDIKLRIVGSGPLESKVRLIVQRLGLGKNVMVLGEKFKTRNFYQKSAIFLATSPFENFLSNSLLEAMASGLAIIATDVGETRNVIIDGENGILIPPKEPKALANAILTLINNKNIRRNLSMNAVKTAKQYDISLIGPKYMKVYQQVLYKT